MTRSKLAWLLCLILLAGAAVPLAATAQEDEDEAEDEADDEAEDDAGEEADDEADAEADDEADDDADEEDEREPDEVKRSVEVESDDEGVTIKLEREDARGEDKIEMGFDLKEATFELSYEAETNDTETEQSLEAVFQALAEYRDTNGNSKYDAGEPIVSAWALGDPDDEDDLEPNGTVQWRTPVVTDITADGKHGKKITATADFGENGTFELRFLVFGDFVNLENANIQPTGAKIDIAIEHYPFQANDTALTLFLETKSETEIEDERGDDEEGVAAPASLPGREVSLVFTWKDHATVDGTTASVHTTVLEEKLETEVEDGEFENETERRFALSYPRGDSIVHDPEAYVAIQSTDEAARGAPGIGALMVLGVLALAAVAATVRASRR